MQIRELMTADPVSTTPESELADSLRVLHERRFRSLPVVGADGAVLGLLTEARAAAAHQGKVAEAMSPDVVTARPDEMVVDVLNRGQWAMQEAVLVVADGRLVGIVTESDACRHAANVLSDDLSVEDHANTSMVCIEGSRPAQEALERLRRSFVHDLVVLDDRVLHGILSVRDLVAARADEDESLTCRQLVREGTHPTVQWDTPLRKAAALMVEHDVACVPVVSDDGQQRVEAVVSRGDVIRALLISGEVGEGDKSIEDVLL
ncbi:MAG: CBS domain-containing protein [Alphaproteobacteria bacterium]|nr:CBS domain-containing protein [Alphaproteobacteria bacterium]